MKATYLQGLIHHDRIETWESELFFNPGPTLFVMVWGNRRWITRTEERVSLKELDKRGYKKTHTTHFTPVGS